MTLSNDALTTIAACEEALGIVAGSENTYLTRLIESASARIKSYCGRTFYREDDIVESVSGYGTTKLLVSRTPILDITSITYDGSTVNSADYKTLVAESGIIYNPAGWYWSTSQVQNIARDPFPGAEDPLFEVTYDGGWVTPNQVDLTSFVTRTLPFDIEQACIELVVLKYRGKGRDPNVTAERLLTGSQTYRDGEDLPESIRSVLDSYKFLGLA